MSHKVKINNEPPMLVSTSWLHDNLNNPKLRILDCSTYLVRDPETTYREITGEADWWNEHIPGSRFINVPEVLSDKSSGLRLTMPAPAIFAKRMAAYGVNNDSIVVLYSAGQIMWATRVWWMLYSIGFKNAVVLDGGFKKWKADGFPVSDSPCTYLPGNLINQKENDVFSDKHEVLKAIRTGDAYIVNALPADQHKGNTDINHGRLGRIASSINLNAFDLINAQNGTFKSTAEIEALSRSIGIDKEKRIICYCGGGISATGISFGLKMAGYNNVSVYDGSMNEWAKDPNLPMEIG